MIKGRDSWEEYIKEDTQGAPGWFSQLSVRPLILAQVMISQFVSSVVMVQNLLGILFSLSLFAPPCSCSLSLSLSLSLKINKETNILKSTLNNLFFFFPFQSLATVIPNKNTSLELREMFPHLFCLATSLAAIKPG